MENQRIIQVEDKVPSNLLVPLSTQHMLAMFNASTLVPFIFGINPAVALFMSSMGTLLFIGVTKREVPAYSGSSLASSVLTGVIISNFGYEYALGGSVAVGFCGCTLVLIVYKFGIEWIEVVLPPAVTGLVVVLIGLKPSGSATSNTGLLDEVLDPRKTAVFAPTLGTAILGPVLFRRLFSVIPILIAVVVGCVPVLACGIVDLTEVAVAPVFVLPNSNTPKLNLETVMTVLPVLLVITSEHIGHQVVISKIVGRDPLKDPGLHRSLFGNNFSTMISGLIGSVPTTIYGENIGVMAVIRVYSVRVIVGTAVLPTVCSFVGKFSISIGTIPGSVIGNISFPLYGIVGTLGLRILVDSWVDYRNSRNLALTSVTFITGLSGIAVKSGSVQLIGVVLVYVVGMILSLIFYISDYSRPTNDQ